jgi:mRNA-degrading endonuclease YafQ of YafQ-DinJ toxin-antitoxin module
MNYRIIYTPSYNKRAARFIRKHPDLIPQYEKTLKLLEIDPFHPSLRLHRLKGSLSDLHSVSINISYRITLELVILGHEIIPVDVGSHDEVYG